MWVGLGTHPNIATAFYVREIGGFPRLLLEKVDGGSLKAWLASGRVGGPAHHDRPGRPGRGRACLRPAPTARLRSPGHQAGQRPADPDGVAKVTDFGMVGAAGGAVGTPAYTTPEVWTGGSITPAADAYSFGVLLYELLAGRRPFDGTAHGTSLGQLRTGRLMANSLGAAPAGPRRAGDRRGLAGGGRRPRPHRRPVARRADRLAELNDSDLDFSREAHTQGAPSPPRSSTAGSPPSWTDCAWHCWRSPPTSGRRSPRWPMAARAAYRAVTGMAYPREEPRPSGPVPHRRRQQPGPLVP